MAPHQLAAGHRKQTYIVVVTTSLRAEGRLVVELAFEIVLPQVPQSCADLRMLQLFLKWRHLGCSHNILHQTLSDQCVSGRLVVSAVAVYWPRRKRCLVCRACSTEQHRQTRSAVHGVCVWNKDNSQLQDLMQTTLLDWTTALAMTESHLLCQLEQSHFLYISNRVSPPVALQETGESEVHYQGGKDESVIDACHLPSSLPLVVTAFHSFHPEQPTYVSH